MHKHIKRWGQVFLKNPDIQKKIADYVNSRPYSSLVEIGPGSGALTKYIDSLDKQFFLVEIDKKLIPLLESNFPTSKVIQGDFLEVDLKLDKPSLLFGNIPYYITSPIINKFLRNTWYEEAVFMIQKECFDSITSLPSAKKYSSFSVFIQTFTDSLKVLDVGRNNFYPIPKVDSVVIHFKKKTSKVGDLIEEYSVFLKKCFFMPRKTLHNNFKKFLSKEAIEDIFSENEIPANIRPDAVSWEKYEDIFLSESGKKFLHNIL